MSFNLLTSSTSNNSKQHNKHKPPQLGCADSGCTSHFICTDTSCTNKTQAHNHIIVRTPDGGTMASTHSATLDLHHLHPDLPAQATTASVLPTLKQPLLSLGQFCDAGFDVVLTSTEVLLAKENKVRYANAKSIGQRNSTTGLWDIPLTPNAHAPTTTQLNNTHIANNAYTKQTKQQLVTWLHAAAFSPVVATWCAAIDRGYFLTWPGLTSALVRKHLPKTVATYKGHLKQDRQGLRSTKIHPAHLHPLQDEQAGNDPHNTSNLDHQQYTVDMTACAPGVARTNCVFLAKISLRGPSRPTSRAASHKRPWRGTSTSWYCTPKMQTESWRRP